LIGHAVLARHVYFPIQGKRGLNAAVACSSRDEGRCGRRTKVVITVIGIGKRIPATSLSGGSTARAGSCPRSRRNPILDSGRQRLSRRGCRLIYLVIQVRIHSLGRKERSCRWRKSRREVRLKGQIVLFIAAPNLTTGYGRTNERRSKVRYGGPIFNILLKKTTIVLSSDTSAKRYAGEGSFSLFHIHLRVKRYC